MLMWLGIILPFVVFSLVWLFVEALAAKDGTDRSHD
jgi:hypothetical protein